MLKKILTMAVAAMLVLGMMIPVVSHAETVMYVYTENGKSLNARSAPFTGDNIVKEFPFGEKVYVDYHLGNGWTALYWAGGDYDHLYVQTRFLVYDKPTKKPTPKPSNKPAGDSSGTVAELNKIFKTYKLVDTPYSITVRPVRASGWANVRFAPSKQAELVSTHKDGEQLLVIAELKDWYQVENPDTGAVGYISTKFVAK